MNIEAEAKSQRLWGQRSKSQELKVSKKKSPESKNQRDLMWSFYWEILGYKAWT